LREASVDIDPRMEMLVARLKSMGYITAMLTNNAREWFDFIKYSGRLKAFDYILTSYDLGVKKPNPLIYEALLGTVGVKAEECVFLDDFKQNAKGARKLGIHDITFKSYEQACEELERILGKRIV
jgi:putative hydrolase of the HAD superfamily